VIALALALLQTPPAHGPEPGPRAPLAGLAGLEVVSRLDFGTAQNRLTAVYVFPDRARWHFESYAGGARSPHQYLYRAGERVHELSTGRSQALEGENRDLVLLQMELRRAALLWPDGFDWQSEDGSTSTAPVLADSCCRERPIGTLLATLEGGRPSRIEARDAGEHAQETLVIESWQERAGRSFPLALELLSPNGGFRETIESIETRVHYLELSFLPPDQRPPPKCARPGPAVGARDLVSMTYAVRALPAGTDWPAAETRARAWIAEAATALSPQGLLVDPIPTFELAADGSPARCLVRLAAPASPPPKGYETKAERPGLFALFNAPAELDAPALARLTEAVPPETRAGTPYVRLHPRAELGLELVLPLEPRE